MSSPADDAPPYQLIYWPGIPGRSEHIRLALEEGGAAYTDTAHTENGIDEVLARVSPAHMGDDRNPPCLAPPILKHGALVLSQTPNILLYLGPKLGLAPRPGDDDQDALYTINQLALTALDGLSNEVHDCHHPIASGQFYEDQKEESLCKTRDYVTNRLPKFMGYFERVLKSKPSGDGPWLHGGKLTYADLVLFQCVDGVKHMFPRAMKKLQDRGDHQGVFALYDAVKMRPRIQAYLASKRRQEYSSFGIYRYYEELDITE